MKNTLTQRGSTYGNCTKTVQLHLQESTLTQSGDAYEKLH